MKTINIRTISDVTCKNFFRDFKISDSIEINFSHGLIDQFIPEIINFSHKDDFILLHISPYAFNSYSTSESFLNSIIQILESLEVYLKNTRGKIILNNIFFNSSAFSQVGFFENYNLNVEINNLLINFAKKHQHDCIFIDIANLISEHGSLDNLSLRNYSIMRFPYSNALRKIIFAKYKFHLKSYFNSKKKAIFVDADNTLWKGVIGEDGVHGIKVDHEFPGSIYFSFQENLLKLKNSGILLCLVTKNNLSDIEEVFQKKEMPLSLDDFIEVKANWDRKSKNIEDLLISLNIGASSTLFIDDNPFEIEEVQRLHTEILCIRFDENNFSMINKNDLFKITDLYSHNLTDEDKNKSESYMQEKERKKDMQMSSSIEDYLTSLSMKMTIFYNNKDHVPRIAQLTQKTNQFNLTTRRSSLQDIEDFMSNGSVYSFSIEDKFGAMGVVGVVIIHDSKIHTFLLSCRAFGREIEKMMLIEAVNHYNCYPIFADYIESNKNHMTKNFYEENGFLDHEEDRNKKSKTYILEKNVQYTDHFFKEITWN